MIGGAIDMRLLRAKTGMKSFAPAASSKPERSRRPRSCVASPPIRNKNALAKALREIGRVERTLFTLDWISDPALRRRSNAGLNKGEAHHALKPELCSFIVLAKSATALLKISATAQAASISAVTAIILWNTVDLARAVAALRGRGEILPDELLAHVAPLGWEHIAFNGDYVWPAEPLGTAFSSLRNPRARVPRSRLACSFGRILR